MSKERARQRKRQQSQKMRKQQEKATASIISKLSFYITTDPLPSSFPPERQDEVNELYFFAKENPKEAIPKLKSLILEYPDIPELYNWLGVSYKLINDMNAYEEIVRLNYQKNPSYLFAKIGYAEQCIHDNEPDKVIEIFDSKLNLALLYPDRNVFHISEVTSFFSILVLYFLAKDNLDEAISNHEIITKIAPEELITQKLRYKILSYIYENE